MRYLMALLIVGLLVMHQDYWNWSDASLWFGFLPHALAWHVMVSLLASCVWWLTIRFAWSSEEANGDRQDSQRRSKGSHK